MNQEKIALLLVVLASALISFRVFQNLLAERIADWLLKKGKVKWAIFFKFQLRKKR